MVVGEEQYTKTEGASNAQYELASAGGSRQDQPNRGGTAFSADPQHIWDELLDDREEKAAHERKHLEREAAGRTSLATDALKRASEILSAQGANALLHSGEKRRGRGLGRSRMHRRNESLEHGVLAEFGLLDEADTQGNERDREFPVSNLDKFFSRMYYYHYERGFHACVSNGVVSLITLGFTLLLSTLIFAFVDWGELLTCTDEEHCKSNFADYWTYDAVKNPNGYHILVWFYCAFFSAYWIWTALGFAQRVKDAIEMNRFYEKDLGVPDSALANGAISWAAVVERFQDMHRAGKIKVAIGKAAEALDAHWIAARIMRQENYLIAIMNHGVLDLHLQWRKWMARGVKSMEIWGNAAFELVQQTPFEDGSDELRRPLRTEPGGFSGGSDLFANPSIPETESLEDPQIGSSQDELQLIATTKIHVRRNRLWAEGADVAFFNKSIEWALEICLLGFMFSDAFTLRKDFLRNREDLRRRFILAGVAHIVLMPFLLVFMLAVFFLQHAQEWRASNNYLGPREWSPLARFMFREFNELPHVFEGRLARSISPATEYQSCFSRPMLATAGRVISFVSGALVAVLLVFTLLEESILLYTKLWGRNLLWYMGILSATFAVTRGLGMPSSRERSEETGGRNPLFDPLSTEDLMTKVRLPKSTSGSAEGSSEDNGGGHSNGTVAAGDVQEDSTSIKAAQLEPNGHPKIAEELMLRVAAHTHYLPDAWRNHCHTLFVRDAFLRLFQYKAALFAQEALAVVFAPLILCFCLPACTDRILQYMELYSVNVDGVGTVCCFSTFDVANYGDPTFIGSSVDVGSQAAEAETNSANAPTIRPLQMNRNQGSEYRLSSTSSFDMHSSYRDEGQESYMDEDEGDIAFTALSSIRQLEVLRGVLEGKMEKSLISFAMEHPSWKPPTSALTFLRTVERLKYMATEQRRQEILQDMTESQNVQEQAAAHLFRSVHEVHQGNPPAAADEAYDGQTQQPNEPGVQKPPASDAPQPGDDFSWREDGLPQQANKTTDAKLATPLGTSSEADNSGTISEAQTSPPPPADSMSPTATDSVMTSPSKQYPFARECSASGEATSDGRLTEQQEKLSEPLVPQTRGFRGAFRGTLAEGLNDDDTDIPSSLGEGVAQRPSSRQTGQQTQPMNTSTISGLLSPPPMSPPLWSPYRRAGGQPVAMLGIESVWSARRGSSGSAMDGTGNVQVFRHGGNQYLAGSTSSFNMQLGGSSIMNISQLQSGNFGVAMSHQAMMRAAALASIGSGYQPWDNSFYWMEQVQAMNQQNNPPQQSFLGSHRLASPEPHRRVGLSQVSVDEGPGGAIGSERLSRPPPRWPIWTRGGHVRHRQSQSEETGAPGYSPVNPEESKKT